MLYATHWSDGLSGRMTNTIDIELQSLDTEYYVPPLETLQAWLNTGFPNSLNHSVVVRVVTEEEGLELNKTWRNKSNATNILSFPANADFEHESEGYLGDLVVTAKVIDREANDFNRDADFHWAHMLTHGILHLLGYDHQQDSDTLAMEAAEEKVLTRLGFPHPYN